MEVLRLKQKVTAVYDFINKSDKLIVVLQGGTGSTKTVSAMQWWFKAMIEERDQETSGGIEVGVYGESFENLRPVMRDLDTYAINNCEGARSLVKRPYYLKGDLHKVTLHNGASLEFKSTKKVAASSANAGQSMKQGKRWGTHIAEAQGLSWAQVDQLIDRTSGRVIIEYNSDAKFWVHEKLLGREDVDFCISSWVHNPWISQTIVNTFRQKCLRPEQFANWIAVYLCGLTGSSKGVIFPFIEWISEEDFYAVRGDLDRHGIGIDYGFGADPLAMVEGGTHGGYRYFMLHEYGNHIREAQIDAALTRIGAESLPISMDHNHAQEQFMNLEQEGWDMRKAVKRSGSIEAGLDLLGGVSFGTSKEDANIALPLRIVLNKNFKLEADNYRRLANNKPIDAFNHIWDACRYQALEAESGYEAYEYK